MQFKKRDIKLATLNRMAHGVDEVKLETKLKEVLERNAKDSILNEKTEFLQRVQPKSLVRTEFRNALREELLYEAVRAFYTESEVYDIKKDHLRNTKDAVIRGFIRENGAINILESFKKTTMPLMEIAKNIENTVKAICEEKKDELDKAHKAKDVALDPDYKRSFINTLSDQKEEIEDVGELVRSHVANTTEDFVASNYEDRQQIQTVMDEVKEKVANIKAADKDTAEEIKESVIMKGKREVNKIKSRKRNILETMIHSLAKRSITESRTEYLTETGSPDLQAIEETCQCMLTMMVLAETFGYKKTEEEFRAIFK